MIKLNSPTFAYFVLAFGQCCVGVNIVISKQLTEIWSVTALLLLRFCLSTLMLWCCHMLQRKHHQARLSDLSPAHWFMLAFQGLCAGAFFNLLFMSGLHYTSASMAGILTSALPAVVVLFSLVILREKLTPGNICCLIAVCGGLLLLNDFSGINRHSWQGDLLVLLSLLPEAAFLILTKRFTIKLPLLLYATLMNFVNLPVFLLVAFWNHDLTSLIINQHSLILLLATSFSTVLFYLCWQAASPRVNGRTAALFTGLVPLSTTLMAWAWLHESLTTHEWWGMGCILIAILANAYLNKPFSIAKLPRRV